MKNIEKYHDAIKQKLQKSNAENLGCAVFDIRAGSGDCGDCDCKECCLKGLEWLNAEYKGPILNSADKEIVKAMIDFVHKCGSDVLYICKFQDPLKNVYIHCKFKDKENYNTYCIESPWFPNNMFKCMEVGKKYTLEELGL